MTNAWTGPDFDQLKRVRPRNSRVRDVVPGDRRAEIVCAAEGGRGHLLAVVYPRAVTPAGLLRVVDQRTARWLGEDFTVACRCGDRHAVDGERLRAAVLASPMPRAGAEPPRIDVAEVVGVS